MPVKMMGAARFRYKKTTTTPKSSTTSKRQRAQSVISLLHSDGHENKDKEKDHRSDSLTVPDLNIRRRSGSVPSIKIVTLASSWNLKTTQVRAVKLTWARLCEPPRSQCKGIVSLVERVWERMDSKDKIVKQIFYNAAFVDSMADRCERRRSNNSIATLRDHTHFFVSLVSQVVGSLESDPQNIFDHIDKIGRNHAYLRRYGFRSSHWEKIGEYFIDIVVIQDCVRGFPEACKAWTLLMSAIIDRLCSAPRRPVDPSMQVAAQEERRNSGSSLSVCPHMERRGSAVIIEKELGFKIYGGSGIVPMRPEKENHHGRESRRRSSDLSLEREKEREKEKESPRSEEGDQHSKEKEKEKETGGLLEASAEDRPRSCMEMRSLESALPRSDTRPEICAGK